MRDWLELLWRGVKMLGVWIWYVLLGRGEP